MENLNANYIVRAEIWLFATTLLYFLMNGAQIFETAVIVPKWTAAPPESFKWLADKNGASLKIFWIVLHSIHEITFILAIVFCWRLDPIRNGLLILFALHFAVRVWTILYFAPHIMNFEKITETQNTVENLVDKTLLWKNLNYLRVTFFLLLSFALIPLCVKLLKLAGKA
ncbi:transposase [Sphingobacteriaceae bacterium]|nr:transposase [Sphingobacteriaceae bacterium]